jgi:hypothetical protein
LIGQSDFVSGRRGESGGSHSLPRVSLCLGPYPHNGHNGHFKNKFAHTALRERDKRSETFREILNGDACHTHLICNAHAQPPDDAGPSVPAPRLKKAEVAKLGAAGTQRVDAVVRWMTGTMGTAAADMARVLQAVPMASTIVAFENLIQRLTNQDSVAYSPTGRRVEGGDGRISGYDNMTFAQKRAAQDDQRRQR